MYGKLCYSKLVYSASYSYLFSRIILNVTMNFILVFNMGRGQSTASLPVIPRQMLQTAPRIEGRHSEHLVLGHLGQQWEHEQQQDF